MGMDVQVKNVKIFNRIDCCSARLSGASVTLWNNGHVIETRKIYASDSTAEIDVNFGPSLTRQVRIDIDNLGYVLVREVQVFDYNNVNRALRVGTSQSTTYASYSSSNAVDGNLNTITHTASSDTGKYHHIFGLQISFPWYYLSF